MVYRFKAEPGKKYVVCLVSTPHIGGYWLETPKQAGDLVYEYRVEGCAPQTLDYMEYIHKKSQPLVRRISTVPRTRTATATSRFGPAWPPIRKIRHTRLSVIYVFPEGTKIDDPAAVYSGSMNSQCVRHIDVGATPEQGSQNQTYDKSDVGFARLFLQYGRDGAAAQRPGPTG